MTVMRTDELFSGHQLQKISRLCVNNRKNNSKDQKLVEKKNNFEFKGSVLSEIHLTRKQMRLKLSHFLLVLHLSFFIKNAFAVLENDLFVTSQREPVPLSAELMFIILHLSWPSCLPLAFVQTGWNGTNDQKGNHNSCPNFALRQIKYDSHMYCLPVVS